MRKIAGMAITAFVFGLVLTAATCSAAINKFKPRTYRMRPIKTQTMAHSFKVSSQSKFKKVNRAFRVHKSTQSTVSSARTNRFTMKTRVRSLGRTMETLRAREKKTRNLEPGKAAGFHQSQFNNLKVQTRYISSRSALSSKY